MLKGANELRLNEATMMLALQEYLNARIWADEDKVVVTGVEYLSNQYNQPDFRVRLKSAAEEQ